ncbi:MAG: AAA-like domain-containing protein [Hydrogenophaga sp.]|uniref:AAA family ATPase n=1 Tax=Hydrogenophaga sp. TaxID=1904254 RepID=UPI00271E68DE|nr:AAA-like domain-containing protein [Hydrogenophaga sp.]MDO9570658.1 AAA-like domain-containing protein [Hydrogenophaga sp.]MDP3375070.1 AAA-like domain-containing protein [Hydrogenophaga sp.]
MDKFFNTAGPNQPDIHYTLSPMQRVDWPELSGLMAARKYFILHAPRQTGKTSLLINLMHHLNAEGHYRALYVNIEAAQAARNDVQRAESGMVQALAGAARLYWKDAPEFEQLALQVLAQSGAGERVRQTLQTWSEHSAKPLVVFFDEVDALVGDTLISLLRQIRAGYAQRPDAFPQSMVLCGVRDVRDYRIHRSDGEIITGGSAFNIKSESIRLGDFTQDDVAELLQQHTDATGQTFEAGVLDEIWADTQGQPWLVNALAYEACFRKTGQLDRTQPVTVELMRQSRERLILRRDTHLDQLADKLREDRVRRVVEPIVAGLGGSEDLPDDDIQYCRDLGLVGLARPLAIANRIYREIIPRQLTWSTQETMVQTQAWYVTPEGRMDMDKLLSAFQQFFRENAQSWLERYAYKEAGPQLLLQAFLQRIVNGGGRIAREYGLGMGRTDLFLQWPLTEQGFTGPMQQVVLELKIQHKGRAATLAAGLEQTARYADQCGAESAHLLIFDRDPATPWDDKVYRQTHAQGGRLIEVWGM